MGDSMRLGVIGAGRVGASFVSAFSKETVGIMCASEHHTAERARVFGVKPFFSLSSMVEDVDTILIAVQDDNIIPLCKALERSVAVHPLKKEWCLFHVSGAMDLTPFEALSNRGIHCGSIHPLQSFSEPSGEALRQIYMAIDGDDVARERALQIVRALDSKPLFVPAKDRMLYHSAACFCSNYVVTAIAIAQKLFSRWTGNPKEAGQAIMPLIEGTMKNIASHDTVQTALTGPISRGDVGTVQKHLSVLPHEYVHGYCAFGKITANLAYENGTLSKEMLTDLTNILAMAEGGHHGKKSNQFDDSKDETRR